MTINNDNIRYDSIHDSMNTYSSSKQQDETLTNAYENQGEMIDKIKSLQGSVTTQENQFKANYENDFKKWCEGKIIAIIKFYLYGYSFKE